MSRLDSFIRRLEAQRACLQRAAELIETVPGPALELGLGNGRTFDHLRTILAGREIYVFDRQVAAHPDCVPDAAHLIFGDIHETLPTALVRIGRRAALAHCDLGTGEAAANAALAVFIGRHLGRLLACGAIVVSDQELCGPGLSAIKPPASVAPGRYFMSRTDGS